MAYPQTIRSERVLTPEGIVPATITFEPAGTGRILRVDPYGPADLDAASHLILPGIVDTHVHINEPGRTEWEGFHTATRAAAAGGCTTVIDMPLNSIPATTSLSGLTAKRNAARGQCLVDYAFWGGVVPGNTNELLPLANAGVRGFKCFLVDSGVPEFAAVSEQDLHRAMPLIAQTGLPLLVHAELPDGLSPASNTNPGTYRTHLASRPAAAELAAIELMIRLCREYRCRVHIVHVSAAEALPLLQEAKSEALPITAETCPHYLHFTAEQIADTATEFKCAPPIRAAANREVLWHGLASGTLDAIATDHSPCPPEMKMCDTGDFSAAWGGIASLSLALSIVWTEARQRAFTVSDVSRWMSANTARLAGLQARKGQIAPGFDADFVVFEPDTSFTVTLDRLHFRHAVSPYLGENLYGKVCQTYLRGQLVFDDAQMATTCSGEELRPDVQ